MKQSDLSIIKKVRQAAGIIIEQGGLTSELAHIAREVGIPTLVGTGPIDLKDGHVVTLNASQGIVTQNKTVPISPSIQTVDKQTNASITAKTVTKIYLNVSKIDTTQDKEYLAADGVGLCKGIDILIDKGIHPYHIANQHPLELRKQIIDRITPLAGQFGDRQVLYYPFDLDSASAAALDYGKYYEPTVEQNPLIGNHGAVRLISSPLFKEEVQAIATVRNKHNQKNVSLIVPFVRSAEEYIQVKRSVASLGLSRSPSFHLYAEIGTPSAVEFIPKIIDQGVDGFIINLDLLTILMLGYDPNSSEVDQYIDPLSPSVAKILKDIITKISSSHINIITVSHKIDQYKDVLDMVVASGSPAISISSHRYQAVKTWIKDIEHKHSNKVG